jgi:crotonobetainyl-CoA:carnitine CoA-transferase CaiB-like acyl-CoA transferase
MKRLGLDYPELAKINPRIIYGAISGYGQTGPAAGRPAYAPVIHASTGYDMAHLFYQQGRQRPDNCGIFVADYASGAYAVGGILAALHQRHVTGKGQMVDVSMFEALGSRTLTVKECVAALEKHGVPCSPYLTVTEALNDPQVEHRGSLCTIEDSAGSYKSPAPPFRFSGSPVQSGPKVADLGEHTESVLQEAGLSEAEIKALAK